MKAVATVIILFTSVLASVAASASPDGPRERVEELLELMDMDSMLDGAYEQMTRFGLESAQAVVGMELDQEERAILEDYLARAEELLRREAGWEAMKEPLIQLYLKHLTEEDINAMLAFYRSPTGQKLLQKMPVLMQESMLIGRQLVIPLQPEMKRLTDEMVAELDALKRGRAGIPE